MTSLTAIVKSKTIKDMLKGIIELTLLILISTVLTRFLWNSALVKHITILTPLGSLKDALILVIALNVLKSSCTCAQA
jgi:hypothetical protein